MWTWRLSVLLSLAMVVGCSQDGKKPKTAREQGYQHWNNTRGAVQYNLAQKNYDSGDMEACRRAISDAIKLCPDNATYRVLSAKQYIEIGRMELAEKELQEASRLDAKNGEVDYLLGVIYQRWARADFALECYSRAAEKQPSELAFIMAKAEALVAVDRSTDALACLQERLTFFENSASIREAVGQLLAQQGKHAEAARVLRQASILAPDDLKIREHLALALYSARDFREALSVLDRLVKDERVGQRADLLAAAAECQLQTGKDREARENFETAAQLDPASTGAWLGLAKAALKLNDLKRVELSVRKAVALDGGNPEAHLMQGYLRLKQNKLPEALGAFRKASALDARDATSLCMIGYVLEKQGKRTDAIGYYGRALKLKPNDELATTLMAQVGIDE